MGRHLSRLAGLARRAARLAARAVAAFLVVTVTQVLAVRFVDPPLTLTMLGEAVEGRRWIAHDSVGLDEAGHVPRAFVSSEDARFFLHAGFDWESVCAALEHNASGGRLRGGSTITQQVAKNVFLWQGRSWLRKGLEAWYTVLLELFLPKERILELYLDVAETGPYVFGAEAGARHHFGRSARDLTADQAARLAGILPDPADRSTGGGAASKRAAWIAANPAPFPGDPGWDLILAEWSEGDHSPWQCLRR